VARGDQLMSSKSRTREAPVFCRGRYKKPLTQRGEVRSCVGLMCMYRVGNAGTQGTDPASECMPREQRKRRGWLLVTRLGSSACFRGPRKLTAHGRLCEFAWRDRTTAQSAKMPLSLRLQKAARLSTAEVQCHLVTAQGRRGSFGGTPKPFRLERQVWQ
jgi:hypothetical protein